MDGKMTRDEAEAVGKYHTQLRKERCLKSCIMVKSSAYFKLIFQRPYYLSLKPESVHNVITKCGLHYRQGKFDKFVTDVDGRLINDHRRRGPRHKLSDLQIKSLLTILQENKLFHEVNNPEDIFFIPFAKDMVSYFNKVAEYGTLYQIKKSTDVVIRKEKQRLPLLGGTAKSFTTIIYVSDTYCNTKRTELLSLLNANRQKFLGASTAITTNNNFCDDAHYYHNITATPFFCFSDC